MNLLPGVVRSSTGEKVKPKCPVCGGQTVESKTHLSLIHI